MPLTVALHCSRVKKLQLVPPPTRTCVKRFVNRLAATIRHGPGRPHPQIHGPRRPWPNLHERGRGRTPVGLDRGRRPSRLKIRHRLFALGRAVAERPIAFPPANVGNALCCNHPKKSRRLSQLTSRRLFAGTAGERRASSDVSRSRPTERARCSLRVREMW
jgi:hypothetical protein